MELVQGAFGGYLHGEGLKSRNEPNFRMTERLYPPSLCTPMHVHSNALFCVVLEGGYQETHRGMTRYCAPPSVLFHAPNEEHLEQFGENGGRSLVVELEPDWMCRVQQATRNPPGSTLAVDGGTLSLVGARLYHEFLNHDQASSLVIEGLMLEVFGEIERARHRRETRPPHWLEESRELIRAQFSQNLSLTYIGREANVHPVYLAQAFRRFYNCTVGEYVRTLRIDFACRQLRASNLPLAEIARRAGFADQSHFNRTFKKMLGVLPSEYRLVRGSGKPGLPSQ